MMWSSFNQLRTGRLLAVAMLPAVVVLNGCNEARVPVYPVTGKVTFQGKPAAGAQVVLNPVHPPAGDVVAPLGVANNDGTFSITVYEPGDGAPQGEYVATVQWFKMVGQASGPNILPKQYANPATSPVKLHVADRPVQIPTIAIR